MGSGSESLTSLTALSSQREQAGPSLGDCCASGTCSSRIAAWPRPGPDLRPEPCMDPPPTRSWPQAHASLRAQGRLRVSRTGGDRSGATVHRAAGSGSIASCRRHVPPRCVAPRDGFCFRVFVTAAVSGPDRPHAEGTFGRLSRAQENSQGRSTFLSSEECRFGLTCSCPSIVHRPRHPCLLRCSTPAASSCSGPSRCLGRAPAAPSGTSTLHWR